MQNQVTSIEQSRRLLELGVPAEKASMFWDNSSDRACYLKIWDVDDETKIWEHRMDSESYVPAFTVADLLEVMPVKITCADPFDGHLRMRRYTGRKGCRWVIDYDVFAIEQETLLDVIVETIEWLLSNGYKLEA